MVQMQSTNPHFLLTDAGLAAMFEVFDDLHDAATEGTIDHLTPVNRRELVGWLQELVYTAQETIAEIEKQGARQARQQPTLQLVK
ncbi:MAG: hypothetical protein JNJ61_11180 [Anaerolineae bacterium]|nr:hypothetical protein [Anaerolineae bacterium]